MEPLPVRLQATTRILFGAGSDLRDNVDLYEF
jgi:hypothetical protein